MDSLRKGGRFRWFRGWRGIALLVLGMAIGLLVVTGSVTALHKTSDTAFCVSCHSMERPMAEYQGSIHYQNHAGIRAECADCHIPGQPLDYLATKIGAVKDIYGEVTGKIDTEEQYNAHKLAMAESVWKSMKANDSATCRSCHSFDAMDILAQQPEARKAHPAAIKAGNTCIDCHRGVAHILPDMREHNASGASQLATIAAATTATSGMLYATHTQPFTLDPAADAAGGTLFPATGLTILTHQQEKLEARLEGWQQDGVPTFIYGAPGKRIISAILSEEAISHIQTLATQTDSQTGTVWHKVSLQMWLPSGSLIADREKIWQYASGLMTANCTGCHGLTALDHFTANQWTGVMKGMAPRTSLDKEQLRVLTQYVQHHASDMTSRLPASEGNEDEK
ncbi:NapC/NirT family cytochrome c [Pantoea sp. FN060301]|uniref:NapC/NirT family cytochrome c n=1 Tax=Pantoea sp. FN060301 TaxID=3420380 RepID=UPI003D17320A